MDNNTINSILAGLLGAFIALVVSYFTTKKRITADVAAQNRQSWINTLRNCVADLQALFMSLYEYKNLPKMDDEKEVETKSKQLNKALQKYYKIHLLINPDEDDHKQLVSYFKRLLDQYSYSSKYYDNISHLQKKITSISQSIFKREWERVKKGK
jgi:predicted RNA-binding protein with EMAP domain